MDTKRILKNARKSCGGRFPAFIHSRAENALKGGDEVEMLDCLQQISDRYPALNIQLPETATEGHNDRNDIDDIDIDEDEQEDLEGFEDSEAELEDLQEFEDEVSERDLDEL